jgi:valyl-tRNA synthetase
MNELPKAYDPKAVEDAIYRIWESNSCFRGEASKEKKPYSIVIPPPNITGILHMGHALNNTLQDILIRYKRMCGFEAEWMPGTDHAGIATQNAVEKSLAKGGIRRQDLGRDKFVEEVWKWREEYGSTIIKQLKKLGCSCDWDRTRFTMDEGLSKAVLEVFIKLYDKGLIYRGNYITNWCPRCQTALSDEESQHKDIDGMLYYIKYPIKEVSRLKSSNLKTSKPANRQTGKPANYIVIATTRPETMLGDVAVAVNPKDKRYKHLKDCAVLLPILNRELKVIYDPLVDMKFGTGALKVTPAHDPVDFELGRKFALEQINVMNDDATINLPDTDYHGMDRLEAREAIVEDLKERGLFIKSEAHRHAVGHCYRCHTMIEPRLSPQWFVRMKPLAKPAIDAVKKGKIKFYPERWTKVYLDWMENIRDWCISRQIWWGHRIPVYYCLDCGEMRVSKTHPESCGKCGSVKIEQDPDVLDTWFSSWLWPFSTFGWPKETPELRYFYPTDALVTAQEIIFFWVARMIMAGMEFMGGIPFKDVYIHGTVRDITGTKMSKSLGNIIDPLDMIAKYGADALRFSIISITAQGQDVYLSESKFEFGRNFANKLWNASRFILMNLEDDVDVDLCVLFENEKLKLPERWILSRLYSTVAYVEKCLGEYKFNEAANGIYEFVWHEFCDWYIEISKTSIPQKPTQAILYKVLEKTLRMLHPFMPFITEEIWQKLPRSKDAKGGLIMVQPWPRAQKQMIDTRSEQDMKCLIDVVSAIRNIRAAWNVDPRSQIKALINTHDKKHAALFAENEPFIRTLARLSEIEYGNIRKPKNCAASVVSSIEVYVPLEGIIDFDKERARLKKEEDRIAAEIKSVAAKLKNRDFTHKAPKEVVEKQKSRVPELELQLERLRQNLKDIC